MNTQNGDKLDKIALYSLGHIMIEAETEAKESICPECPYYQRIATCFPCLTIGMLMNHLAGSKMLEKYSISNRFGIN